MKSLLGRHFALLLTIATGVAIVFVVGAGILELDPAWNVPAGADAARDVLRQHGPLAAVGLLYLEESGVPMPVPGDFFVMLKGGKMGSEYEAGLVEPSAAGILPHALAALPPPPSPPRTPLLPL